MKEDMSDNELKDFYKCLASHLQSFILHYQKNITHRILYNNQFQIEPQKFYYTFLAKTINTLEGANIFICNFEQKRTLHPTLFILLRSMLADIIVVECITLLGERNHDIEERINKIYYDHITAVYVDINGIVPEIYGMTMQEAGAEQKRFEEKVAELYPDWTPKCKKTSINALLRQIYSQSKNRDELAIIREAWNQYAMFSKFEHLGALSLSLTHRSYDDTQLVSISSDITTAIRIVIMALFKYVAYFTLFEKSDWIELNTLKDNVINHIAQQL